MKVSKSQCLLYIYNLLVLKGEFSREEVLTKLEIPALTFHRYVQELKAFISNFELDFDLVYDRNQQKYQLIKR